MALSPADIARAQHLAREAPPLPADRLERLRLIFAPALAATWPAAGGGVRDSA